MKLFGTDGIRGIAGEFPLNKKTVFSLGLAIYDIIKPKSVIIGKDTRVSSDWIEEELAKALNLKGVDVFSSGVLPTPALSMLTRKGDFSTGVMISASHNPPEYNGVKIFNYNGEKIGESLEERIEKRVYEILDSNLSSNLKANEVRLKEFDPSTYFEFLLSTVKIKKPVSQKKVVIDCGYGATYREALFVFKKLGYDVVELNCKPKGEKINVKCGALHPEIVSKRVLDEKAFLGFSYDGDGDRVMAVDDKGGIFNGDHMLFLLSKAYLQDGYRGGIVGTIMSNLSLERKIEDMGLQFYRTPVGDKYVWEKMKETDSLIGGETSGHIILKDFHTTGDGVLTSLKIIEYLENTEKTLSSVKEEIKLYPQKHYSIRYREKIPLSDFDEIIRMEEEIKERFNSKARTVIRYSGTEPILRIMVEGEDIDFLSDTVESYIPAIKKRLGG